MKGELAHLDLVARPGRAAPALEDVLQSQQQFARLERLGDVVIDPDLEPLDALLGFGACRQHADRDVGYGLQAAGQLQAALAGHHDVENDNVEGKPAHGGARAGGIGGRGDAEAALEQVAGQQVPNTLIVVDNQDVRRIVG